MTRKGSFRKYLSVMILALFTLSLNAQVTIADVINKFNAGAEDVAAGNYEAAIAKFEETITLEGIPARLVDTAGMRNAKDEVEAIGVERARSAAPSSSRSVPGSVTGSTRRTSITAGGTGRATRATSPASTSPWVDASLRSRTPTT